jgi:hypothetical protein
MNTRKGFISPLLLLLVVLVILYLNGWDVREILEDVVDFIYSLVRLIAGFVRDLLG